MSDPATVDGIRKRLREINADVRVIRDPAILRALGAEKTALKNRLIELGVKP